VTSITVAASPGDPTETTVGRWPPEAPDTVRLAAAGTAFAAYDVAAASATEQRPVLLVPGYTGSKEDFAALAPLVSAAGRRVLAYDQRGQNESPGPDDAAAYSVRALASDLLAVVDALRLAPVHLVGHSFGGLVARAAVIERPTAFASLTLLDSGPAALPEGPRLQMMRFLSPLLAEGGLVQVWDAMQQVDNHPRVLPVTPAMQAFLRRRFLSSSAVGLAAMGDALREEPDRVETLAAAGVPVLVAYGEADDAWSPSDQLAMAERLGAAVVEVPGAMHSPAQEAPAPTARGLLDFWESVEA